MTGLVRSLWTAPTRLRTAIRRRRLAAMIVRVAREELGKGEVTQNEGPDIDRYARAVGARAHPRFYWCAALCVWVYVEACRRLGYRCPLDVRGCARVRTLMERVVEAGGVLLDEPEPGCLVAVERGSRGGSAHARLCEAWAGDATYDSIEGNSGPVPAKVRRGSYRVNAPGVLGFFRWPVP